MADAQSILPKSFPYPRTRLVGREAERESLRAFLITEAVPLLTLTGPGGVGKTRLALAVAQHGAPHFADGLAFVDLTPVSDFDLVAGTVASSLGIPITADRPLVDALIGNLRGKQLLLCLDNCEHLLPAVADLVATLLAACPAVQILATSRERLHVRGEQEFAVEPLALPSLDALLETVLGSDAVRLFAARTRSVRPSFRVEAQNAVAVAHLCRALDGLPLAIELAAAHGAALSPAALLAQMGGRLDMLAGGARDLPARQRTIRETIAWSYDRLDDQQRLAFCRLAVFDGGWTIAAAAAVLDHDELSTLALLESLVTKSLIRPTATDPAPRFTMLEMIRAFGLEQLSARGEAVTARDRHAAYFQALAARLWSIAEQDIDDSEGTVVAFETENANFESALAHFEHTHEVDPLLSMSNAFHGFWLTRGYADRSRGRLEWALGSATDLPDDLHAMTLANLAGALFFLRGEEESALAMSERALTLAEASQATRALIKAAEWCGMSAYRLGRPADAQAAFATGLAAHEGLADEPWARQSSAHFVNLLGFAALAAANLEAAERYFLEAVVQHNHDRSRSLPSAQICYPLAGLGDVARYRADPAAALVSYQEALTHARRGGDLSSGFPLALAGIAGTLTALGRWQEGALLFGATEALCDRSGYPFYEHPFLWQRALGLPEPWQRADEPFGAAETLRDAIEALGKPALPPLPDRNAAAELWTAGRAMPLDLAVSMAFAVSLTAPSPSFLQSGPLNLRATDPLMLTRREREVLGLLSQRLTDAEIADRLFISPRTASSHVANILAKLDVGSRREAVAYAAAHGMF